MMNFQLNDRYSVRYDGFATFLVDRETEKKDSISRELGNLLIDTAELAQELTGYGCQVAIEVDLPEMGKREIKFTDDDAIHQESGQPD